MEIYDGWISGSQKIGIYCGSDIPPRIVSTQGKLVVVLRTDDSISAKGFAASVHATPRPGAVQASSPHRTAR